MKKHFGLAAYVTLTLTTAILVYLAPGPTAWHIVIAFCAFVTGVVFDQAIVVGWRKMLKEVTTTHE